MRGARAAWVLALTAATGARAQAPTPAPRDSLPVRVARITYLTPSSAYLDAGRLEGLRDSARVDVVRGGGTIAVLKVQYLASHQASCAIVSARAALVVGDSVRFVAALPERDTTRVPVAAAAPGLRRTSSGLRGRLGVEYLSVGQLGGPAGISQPAFDARLDGHPFSAPGVALSVDVRARSTATVLSDGSATSESRNRVYQAALTFNAPGSPARVTVGRQISGNLASVGVFDGVLAELNGRRWSAGVFAGTQPLPLQLDVSSEIAEFGTYLQRHSAPGASSRWAVTLGASDSYDNGQANREFGFGQLTYLGPRVIAMVSQEVDYYRPWKLLSGMDAVSPTSTFAIVQYRVVRALTFDAGLDNRRNVRLYQDIVNPATAFDDSFRQGAWVGVSSLLGRYRLGVDARSSSGGPAGSADAYTVSAGADRLTALALTVRLRSTRYVGPSLTGWLHAVALSLRPTERTSVAVNGGVRQELDPTATPVATVWSTWVGFDADVDVARSWYALVSITRETGGFENDDQMYAGLSYRF